MILSEREIEQVVQEMLYLALQMVPDRLVAEHIVEAVLISAIKAAVAGQAFSDIRQDLMRRLEHELTLVHYGYLH